MYYFNAAIYTFTFNVFKFRNWNPHCRSSLFGLDDILKISLAPVNTKANTFGKQLYTCLSCTVLYIDEDTRIKFFNKFNYPFLSG